MDNFIEWAGTHVAEIPPEFRHAAAFGVLKTSLRHLPIDQLIELAEVLSKAANDA